MTACILGVETVEALSRELGKVLRSRAMKLLLVEDEPTLRTTLQRSLERRGFTLMCAADGPGALAAWAHARPDLVLLDLSLPGLDGLEVLARARASGWAQPVLILTARGTVGDRVLGLNAGADDYLAKPFDLDELEARIRALARRSGRPAATLPTDWVGSVQCADLRLDTDSGAIYQGARALELTPRETAMLGALMRRPGQALSKAQLFAAVFPDEPDVQYEAIEVVAYRLRKKLSDTRVQLMTLRGLGYLVKAQA